MHGFPKHLNSKVDYEYVRVNFPKEKWLPFFEELLNKQKVWFYTKTLAEGEVGITDDTHKVVENEDMDKTIIRYQYEFIVDENSQMIKLGYTKEEIEDIIGELPVMNWGDTL